MKKRPIDYLRKGPSGGAGEDGEVNVLVDLVESPDAACLDRLRGLGLVIQRMIGKRKIMGSISREDVDSLRADDAVREVELSVKLRKHRGPGS